jgi:hypothetical protein
VARVIAVFTPNDIPTFTYVDRPTQNFEQRLERAFQVPKMIISISGPSKSGKTVLVKKVIEEDNLIPISGASVRSADELWSKVLGWMESPIGVSETDAFTKKGDLAIKGGGKVRMPLVAEGAVEGSGSVGTSKTHQTTKTFVTGGLQQVIDEIRDSSFVVFVDDFHYIPLEAQKEIGRQIKEAAEAGVRICTASVPHRSDDVVRSNTELRGRVTGIDMDYWNESELQQIGYLGFQELNIDVSPTVLSKLSAEAFGSPQLMKAICLNFCIENNIHETLKQQTRIEMNFVALQDVLESTSTLTNYSSMISTLHSGPRQRGMERKEFQFTDGTRGDVYRCVLLAIKADPPRLSFKYDEILRRTQAICQGDSPVGSSVAQALAQMEKLSQLVQEAPVIEWDEDVLDIVEPYFLFFLRCSPFLGKLGQPK